MNKLAIHLIFLPIIAALLLAWGYFGKAAALHVVNPNGSVSAESVYSTEGSYPAEGSYPSTGASAPTYTETFEGQQLAEEVSALQEEIDLLRTRQNQEQQNVTDLRDNRLQQFAQGIDMIRNTEANEFQQHPTDPEATYALQDFLLTNEHVRNLNIQVSECTAFGCELFIPPAQRTIANYMRLNRALLEQSQFGSSSVHVFGGEENQRIMVIWGK